MQEIGGALCLIADNRDNANPEEITMVDDGTGISVAIPTMMISKEDGQMLKNYIKQTEDANSRGSTPREFTVLLIDFESVFLIAKTSYSRYVTTALSTISGTPAATLVRSSSSSRCPRTPRDWARGPSSLPTSW